MTVGVKPIYLLADSRLLFPYGGRPSILAPVTESAAPSSVTAAYLGASNGDQPEFYGIFEAAMDVIGVHVRRLIPSAPTDEDVRFLRDASLIVLAGGDVLQGWHVFEQTGLKDLIQQRYRQGAWLVGVSAGAVQLGLMGWSEGAAGDVETYDTFGLVPYVISAHDERNDWAELKRVMCSLEAPARGIGLPFGGGAKYHPDRGLEPLGTSLHTESTALTS
jgi:cyanophycinase